MQAQRMKNQRKKFIFTFIFLLFFLVTGVLIRCDAYYIQHCEPVDLTDLSRQEIVELSEKWSFGFFSTVYRLKAQDYQMLDNFHEVKIVRNGRIRQWYAYYSVSFRDKNGEEVVMAVKADRRYVDLEKKEINLYGRLAQMDNDNTKRLRESTGDEELGHMLMKDLSRRQAPVIMYMSVGMAIVSGAGLILLIVRRIQQH